MFVFRQDEFKDSKNAIDRLSKLGLQPIGKYFSKSFAKIRQFFIEQTGIFYNTDISFQQLLAI